MLSFTNNASGRRCSCCMGPAASELLDLVVLADRQNIDCQTTPHLLTAMAAQVSGRSRQ